MAQAFLSWASLETSVPAPAQDLTGIALGFGDLGTLTAITASSAQAFLSWAELETSVASPSGPSPLVNGQSGAFSRGDLTPVVSKVLGGYDLALTPATITAFGGETDDPTAQSGEFAIGDLTGEASYTLLSQTLTGGLGTFTSRFGDPTFILGDLTPVVSLDLVGVSIGSETGAFQEQIDEGGISILLTGLTLGIAPGSVLISNVTRDLVGISMGLSIPSTISGTRWEDTPTPDSIWTDVPEEDTTWTPV